MNIIEDRPPQTTAQMVNRLNEIAADLQCLRMMRLKDNKPFDSSEHSAWTYITMAMDNARYAAYELKRTGP